MSLKTTHNRNTFFLTGGFNKTTSFMKKVITIPQMQADLKKVNYETIPATYTAITRTLLKYFHLKAICLDQALSFWKKQS